MASASKHSRCAGVASANAGSKTWNHVRSYSCAASMPLIPGRTSAKPAPRGGAAPRSTTIGPKLAHLEAFVWQRAPRSQFLGGGTFRLSGAGGSVSRAFHLKGAAASLDGNARHHKLRLRWPHDGGREWHAAISILGDERSEPPRHRPEATVGLSAEFLAHVVARARRGHPRWQRGCRSCHGCCTVP